MELLIKNLEKKYSNGVQALDNVSLEIGKGMFGLLGPNGAGKSTLMRTLATLQDVDKGTITLGAIDLLNDKDALRQVLGYLPQEFGVYPRTSAEELLNHLALLKGIASKTDRKYIVDQLLIKVNLWEQRKKAVSNFSGGMRQRFGIAQSLIGNPKLVIVDEPTAGLDPGERNRFYNILSEIGENIIVILSTHIVQDVRELCNNMAIMDKGKVLFSGSTDDALLAVKGKIWAQKVEKAEISDYNEKYQVLSSKLVAGRPLIHIYSDTNPQNNFTIAEENLEDVFFAKLKELV
ncbi:ABC transporter ATP-binding protein [Flavobacterium cerinum]|uniref:ABC transporter ATP-binding protein n=1 Tax=Flavobacterium cerinum TaxID=2502784 RepID=A0A444H1G7_9FLAO|nr:ABC transporter ATP-binding protein [Flavobacterium cerinum]RWW96723.1 ABC transporter ATP-binding protein [Flavobacterium cerinum]